jgi:signal transduction histidine kinase
MRAACVMTRENSTIRKMVFNKITLAFPGNTEALFLEKYFTDSIIHFRVAFVLVTVLYALFGYLDLLIVPASAESFHIIRYYFVVPLLSAVFFLSFTRYFSKIWQELLLICFIAGGSGISIMTMLEPENYSYYAGMMLIFSAGYFFIKLRFFYATIAGWTTLLFFNLGNMFFAHTAGIILISYNFFFISANLICMFAAYNIEYYTRRDFYLKQELDLQKGVLEVVNENLEIRNKEIEQFSYMASHDLQEPLRTLTNFSRLIKEEYADKLDEDGHKYIEFIYNSASRMKDLVRGLLDYSLLQKSNLLVAVDCNKVVNEVLSDLNDAIKANNAQVTVQDLPQILAYATELRLLFQNLINNAIKFRKKDVSPEIIISGSKRDKDWQFSIKDNGIGIREHDKEKIFILFKRIHDRDKYEGTGIGLAHCKKIVDMHRGKIWVESNNESGSTFMFTIPI